jgi:hypothetical protein
VAAEFFEAEGFDGGRQILIHNLVQNDWRAAAFETSGIATNHDWAAGILFELLKQS